MVKHTHSFSCLKGTAAFGVACLAVLGLTVVGAGSCSQTSGDASRNADVAGSVQVALEPAPGVIINSAAYVLTGPGGFTRSGSVDVSHSTTLSFVVGAIPAGTGYVLTVTAISTDANVSCAGTSAPFTVMPGLATIVPLGLTCHEASQTGTVIINGTLNICPVVDGISASPAQVALGGSIDLTVTAHDPDHGPSSLAYAWTATTGVFSDAAGAQTSFACTVAGPVILTAVVSDGDPQPGCAATSSVTVTCAAGGAGGSSGAGGAGGAGGGCASEACTLGDTRCLSAGSIQICAADATGCARWTTVACPTGEVCERHAPAACADPAWAAWPLPGDGSFAFTDNMDTTFTDDTTDLMWQRLGQNSLSQSQAAQYCRDLIVAGYDDWRLPTLIELLSTTAIFSNGEAVPFLPVNGAAWTATPVAADPTSFWTVDFLSGEPLPLAALSSDVKYWAHCVR